MIYRILQYRGGIPRLVSSVADRKVAFALAYALAGLPFVEHGDKSLALIHGRKSLVAVETVKGDA